MGVQRKKKDTHSLLKKWFVMTKYRKVFDPLLFEREWLLALQLYTSDCITIDSQITVGIGEPCWQLASRIVNVGGQRDVHYDHTASGGKG